MSRLDEILRDAESLEPDDRLRLVEQLWASLPAGVRAKTDFRELRELRTTSRYSNAPPAHESPWQAVMDLLLPRSAIADFLKPASPPRSSAFRPPSKLYAATRRFDLATLFVAMAGYSLFFALMAMLEVPPFWKLYLGALIAIVGVGQALLERVIDPRRASIFVGAAAHTFLSLVIWFVAPREFFVNSFFFVAIINGLILGGALGYIAGTLVGGVFLVADALRGKFSRHAGSDSANTTIDAPTTASIHPLDNPVH